jgi:glycosyltransferase involved in cell wall biosynthesis
MNILYDHQIFTFRKYSGVSRYFHELISNLCSRRQVDLSLFLGFHMDGYGTERLEPYCRHYWGVKRPDIPIRAGVWYVLNNFIFERVTGSWNASVYHQTYYRNLAKDFKGKRVVTVFDMIHERFSEAFPAHDRTPEDKRRAVERADAVICISEATRRDLLERLSVPEDKIKVIYLGNSLTQDVHAPPLIDTPYILFVGYREGYKNFEQLLSVYAGSGQFRKNISLVCFGGNPFSPDECRRFAESGLADRLIWKHGGDEVLSNLYRYASVFVYPSIYEGFGIPLLEAMHYGCPVIACRAGSIPEVLGAAGWYFEPDDDDSLNAALTAATTDEEQRSSHIKAGYERERMFSRQRCADETLELYKGL